MKRMMIMGFLMMAGSFAFGQHGVTSDPSYSVNNYKHPNKAAYARKYKLDKSTTLSPITVEANDNYKQPYATGKRTEKYAVTSTRVSKTGASYKHPYGL